MHAAGVKYIMLKHKCLHLQVKAYTNVMYVRRDLVTVGILRHAYLYMWVEDRTNVIFMSVKSYLFGSLAVLRDAGVNC